MHVIHGMRGLSVGVFAACALLCGCETSPMAHPGAALDLTEFETVVAVDGESAVVKYTLRNTGSTPIVAYNRGWVADADDPQAEELRATQGDVQIVAADDKVEFSLRSLRDCDVEPATAGCKGDGAAKPRLVGTEIGGGEELSDRFVFDAAEVWPDYPASAADAPISLSGKSVRFCLGADRPKHPAADDMYSPTAEETVLCGESVKVDEF
ncbi:MAG: hypothetical protein ACRDXX_02975 [Stackebrandtia sp.]